MARRSTNSNPLKPIFDEQKRPAPQPAVEVDSPVVLLLVDVVNDLAFRERLDVER